MKERKNGGTLPTLLRIGRNENRSTKALGQQNLTRVWSIEMKKIWLEIFTF